MSVVTGEVRFSYCNLFTAKAKKPGDEPKFSTTLLIPKSDIATRQRIDADIAAAMQEGTNTKWNGVRPPIIPIPVHDGDGVRPSDGMPFPPECKGHWVVTASDKNRPEVVDANLNPILNQSDVYSGMYGRASIRFYPYINNGKKGIGCGLGNVQKLRDGEPLAGSRSSAADDFGGGAGGYAPPAYPQQPMYPQQPAQPQYQQPMQPGYQQPPAAPVYTPQPNYGAPAPVAPQPIYPQQPVPIDPITGKPLMGNVMGL